MSNITSIVKIIIATIISFQVVSCTNKNLVLETLLTDEKLSSTTQQGQLNFSSTALPRGQHLVPDAVNVMDMLDSVKQYENARGMSEPVDANEYRDYVIYNLMTRSDQLCSNYLSRLYMNRSTVKFGTQFAGGVLALASVVTKIADTSRILTAISESIGRGATILDTEFLAQAQIHNLLSRIRVERDKARNVILAKLAASKNNNTYNINAAMYDIVVYHRLCNMFDMMPREGDVTLVADTLVNADENKQTTSNNNKPATQ